MERKRSGRSMQYAEIGTPKSEKQNNLCRRRRALTMEAAWVGGVVMYGGRAMGCCGICNRDILTDESTT